MKAKELIGMLHGLEDFELKDCALTAEILDALDAQPVVHGEWVEKKIIVQNERGYVVQARCSKCNRYSTQLVSQPKVIVYDYCPRCGSRMVQDGKAD